MGFTYYNTLLMFFLHSVSVDHINVCFDQFAFSVCDKLRLRYLYIYDG